MTTAINARDAAQREGQHSTLIRHRVVGTHTGALYLDGTPVMQWEVHFDYPHGSVTRKTLLAQIKLPAHLA